MEVDEWLDSAEVTKLTTEWLGCSVGRAEQIVREAYTSGYVRKESALSRFNIRPGVLPVEAAVKGRILAIQPRRLFGLARRQA
jgi:hypothetical protein